LNILTGKNLKVGNDRNICTPFTAALWSTGDANIPNPLLLLQVRRLSANSKSQQSQICWKNLSTWRGMPRTRSQKPHLAITPKLTAKHKQKHTAGRGVGKFW